MRNLSLVACAAFFASCGSALAADCGKGMLWPYVRAAGDCLTDAEIASGKTGVYTGSVDTNVDVSAIKPAAPAQNAGGGTGMIGSLFGDSAAPAATANTVNPAVPAGANVACNKGAFWPFVREPGDCLTNVEKRSGATGVYGGGAAGAQVTATNVSAAPNPSAAGAQTPAPAPAPTDVAAACHKSWLWPFVRDAGDCPTDAEKK